MPELEIARIHPPTPLQTPLTAGDYRARDILNILGDGLPANVDVFHNLPWSSMHQGHQHFGELDLVVISTLGHILLIGVKAGAIEEKTQPLVKSYGGIHKDTDIGHQIRRQHSTMLECLRHNLSLEFFLKIHLLQAPDLFFQLFHPRNHGHIHAVIFGSLFVKRRCADVQLTANIWNA